MTRSLSQHGVVVARMAIGRPGKGAHEQNMVKGIKRPAKASSASREPAGRRPRPDIVHTSVYLPEAVYEALREAAFKERCKIHDLIMQGIDMALRKRGYPSVDHLRAGRKR